MNPYSGVNFFEFFEVFFVRLFQCLRGELSFSSLASDEVQIFSLLCIGLLTSLLGSFLVVRKMTMLANSLSHTILLGIVLSYLLFFHGRVGGFQVDLKVMLVSAIISALLTNLLTELFTKGLHLQEDASIGLVFSTLFALGIVLVTIFSRNTHIGTEVIIGNVDGLHRDDLKLLFGITLAIVATMVIFYKELYVTTFDEGFSKSIGISPRFYHYMLMFLTAIVAIASFRAVGVFLVLALLVGPILAARVIAKSMKTTIFIGILFSCVLSLTSVALSRHILSTYRIPLSTAGILITLVFISYALILSISLLSKRLAMNKKYAKAIILAKKTLKNPN